MDNDNLLDTFRRQWTQEISTKKPSENIQPKSKKAEQESDDNTPSQVSDELQSGKIATNKSGAFEICLPSSSGTNNKTSTEQLDKCLPKVNVNKLDNTYLPFSIVGDLLNDQSIFRGKRKVSNEKTEEKNDPESKCKVTNERSARQKYKRLKLTKLKDLFVNRIQSEMPQERLLDRLISDIVSIICFHDSC